MYAAPAHRLLDIVRDVPDDVQTLLVVGHNPGMEQLASLLTGEDVIVRTAGTASIAVIGVDGPWSELDAMSAVLRIADARTARS